LRCVEMIANTQAFVARVAALAGVPTERAERATQTVLSGMGAYLTPTRRELVSDELPPALAAILVDNDGLDIPIDDRLLGPGTTSGQAHDLLASVCAVLADELSHEALGALSRSLPIAVGRLLRPFPTLDARRTARP
jgi:uncharacterized protein (DUF2267 family)